MAAAEFSVKVSGAAAAAERSPLRWPPPLAASCRVLQNGGRRRSRAGLLSSTSGPPRNPWPLLPFPGRPGRRGLQSGLSGGRGAARGRRASVAGLAPRREGRGPRRGPAVGAGPARRTSPEPGLPVGRRCVGPVAGRPPRSGRARRRAVTGGTRSGGGGRASGREAAFLRENKGRPGGGASRPAQALARRKPGHTGLGGGTRCSFVRAEWGGGFRCHVVAPLFRRLPTRALWEGVKGRPEDRAVPGAGSETLAGLSVPGPRTAVRQISGHRRCLKGFC